MRTRYGHRLHCFITDVSDPTKEAFIPYLIELMDSGTHCVYSLNTSPRCFFCRIVLNRVVDSFDLLFKHPQTIQLVLFYYGATALKYRMGSNGMLSHNMEVRIFYSTVKKIKYIFNRKVMIFWLI